MNDAIDREKFDTVIEAGHGQADYWRDVWSYRELFAYLAWRDFLIRYKQTAIGILWSVVRPLLSMVLFTVIFGKVAKLPSEGDAPYAVMVLAALLPWQVFANTLQSATNSLVGNRNLISKIYFPRIILPMSGIIVSCVDFLIALLILFGVMLWYGHIPGWGMLMLPLLLLLTLAAATSIGLTLAALNVYYRDFSLITPFIIQFGLFISPVAYSSSAIANEWRWLYSLNPLVGVIDGFRWAVIGEDVEIYLPGMLISLGLIAALLIFGTWFFRRVERGFADVV